MLIKNWMSPHPVTIDQNDTLIDATKLFRTRMISMLPVMNKDKLVGVLTDGDLKKALPSDATTLDKFEMSSLLDRVKIATIMSSPPVTIPLNRTVDEAASLMLAKGISGLPVTDRNTGLAGVITKSDVFKCFVSFTGVAANGQIFAFRFQDHPGAVKKILNMITECGARLSSVLTSYDDLEPGFKKVFIHTFDMPEDRFEVLVDQFHLTGQLEYVADLSRNFRKIT